MHYGIFVILFIRLMLKLAQKENSTANLKNNPTEEAERGHGVFLHYFSNGKKLDRPHVYYYMDLLNLQDAEQINDLTIEIAAEKSRAMIHQSYADEIVISSRDLAAAKFYLLDQWAYVTSYN